MHIDRFAGIGVVVLFLVVGGTARAGHHRWDLSEVFSDSSGAVQFVELFSANDGEPNLNGFSVTSGSGTFTFVGNLPSSATANTWVLVGTSAFALASGAPAPDYVLPDNFFDPAGDTLNYAGVDTWVVSGVPTDGVNSLHRATGVGTNSPTNFAGTSGSIDVSGGGNAVPGLGGWALVALSGFVLAVVASRSRWRPRAAAA